MSEPSKSGKWKYILGITVAIVLALTNPSEEKHKEIVFDRVSQHALKEGFWATLGVAMGKDLVLAQFQYHNYLLFSTLTFKDERATIGVLGNVLVND